MLAYLVGMVEVAVREARVLLEKAIDAARAAIAHAAAALAAEPLLPHALVRAVRAAHGPPLPVERGLILHGGRH
jgi:hypothetical protein